MYQRNDEQIYRQAWAQGISPTRSPKRKVQGIEKAIESFFEIHRFIYLDLQRKYFHLIILLVIITKLTFWQFYWPFWRFFGYFYNSVFHYELGCWGFHSHWSHLNFWYCACFNHGVSWYSGNFGVCDTIKTNSL